MGVFERSVIFIAFKSTFISYLTTAIILLCAVPALAAGQNGLNKDKLTRPEKIIEPLERGQEFVRVTVYLTSPKEALAKKNWRSEISRSNLRKEIRRRQEEVFATLSQDESLVRHRFENFTSFSAEVTAAGLHKLSNDPRVESIEPVFLLEPHVAQGIDLMNGLATRSAYNGQGISIAICDTGIDYNHPALGGGGFPNTKVIGGYDFGDNDSNPIPNGEAHGTSCAGIAAGDDTGVGDYIGGVANGAKLYALKITAGSSGSAYNDDMAAAWDWCVTHQNDDPDNPIMVISTSFGGDRFFNSCDSDSSLLTNAANSAAAAGLTLLASSGNDGYCDSISSPACISSIISVGAVWDASVGTYSSCVSNASCATPGGSSDCGIDEYSAIQTSGPDVVTVYSNAASFLDILAPSHLAYTTDIVGTDGYSTDDYDTSFGGTSAACPYAAGAVAVLQSAAKNITGDYLTPDEIRVLLTSTGDDVTDDKSAITKPRINLGDAISVLPTEQPPAANDVSKTTLIDTPVTITLDATDDGRPDPPAVMTYIITSPPSNGQLSDPGSGIINNVPYTLAANGNQIIYTPDDSYAGTDSFQYKANDSGVAPDGGDSNTASVFIDVFDAIYFAPMDTNPGWTYSGNWAWGMPTGLGGGSYGNPDPTSGYTGSNVVGYNLSGDYEDNLSLTRWATTPPINCANYMDVTLAFYRWLNVERSKYDHVYVEVSNNGTNWTTIWENPDTHLEESSWSLQTIDISAVADNQPTVYIRWGIGETDSSWRYSGWNIDDVKVSGDSFIPQHTLTASSTTGGSVSTPGEGAYTYNQGTVVGITAAQDTHYHFVNWTGTSVNAGKVADPNAAETTVTMDDDYTVHAVFAIHTFILNYTAGPGGTLTGKMSQIVDYGDDGTVVTAVPNSGYYFVNWSDGSTDNPRTDPDVTENISVTANFADNPVAISGHCLEPDDVTAIEGVQIEASGTTSSGVTDPNGYYELIVDYGWSGTIEPNAVGYLFDPNETERTLVNVTDETVLDLTGYLEAFIISGHILDNDSNKPLEGATVTPENGGGYYTAKYDDGGIAVTDANGFYEVLVDYGWSGSVVPSQYAYAFEPNAIAYTNVAADVNEPQNYTGTLLVYTITGIIKNPCQLPIEGVFLQASSGSSDVTDPNGHYEVWVDYNWSGTVTPSKDNYTFDPNVTTYTNVLGDEVGQEYTAVNIYDLDCNGSIGLGDLTILCQNWLQTGPAVPGDLYKDDDDIVNFLDFSDFAAIW